jgi:hypothetical protein
LIHKGHIQAKAYSFSKGNDWHQARGDSRAAPGHPQEPQKEEILISRLQLIKLNKYKTLKYNNFSQYSHPSPTKTTASDSASPKRFSIHPSPQIVSYTDAIDTGMVNINQWLLS